MIMNVFYERMHVALTEKMPSHYDKIDDLIYQDVSNEIRATVHRTESWAIEGTLHNRLGWRSVYAKIEIAPAIIKEAIS